SGGTDSLAMNETRMKHPTPECGEISFNEAIFVLDCQPRELGHDQTIVFYNDADQFVYEPPVEPLDLRSGIICSPTNFCYEDGGQLEEGYIRMTSLANPDYWMSLPDEEYYPAKAAWGEGMAAAAVRHIPDFRSHVIDTDIFTPRTIRKFTGHDNGAVYGAPRKILDGRTPIENLY